MCVRECVFCGWWCVDEREREGVLTETKTFDKKFLFDSNKVGFKSFYRKSILVEFKFPSS